MAASPDIQDQKMKQVRHKRETLDETFCSCAKAEQVFVSNKSQSNLHCFASSSIQQSAILWSSNSTYSTCLLTGF